MEIISRQIIENGDSNRSYNYERLAEFSGVLTKLSFHVDPAYPRLQSYGKIEVLSNGRFEIVQTFNPVDFKTQAEFGDDRVAGKHRWTEPKAGDIRRIYRVDDMAIERYADALLKKTISYFRMRNRSK